MQREQFGAKLFQLLDIRIVVPDFNAKAARDLRNQLLHFPLLRFASGFAVSLYRLLILLNRQAVFAQRAFYIRGQRRAADERIPFFDVDVNIRQRFQRAIGLVIGVFQQFDPEAQTADFDGIRVDVHAEQAAFDERLLFVEQRRLHALAFRAARTIFEQVAVVIPHDQFVVFDGHEIFLQPLSVPIIQNPQIAFDGNQFVQRGDEEMAGADRRIADFQAVDNLVRLRAVFDVVVQLIKPGALPPLALVELLDNGAAQRLAAHVHRDEAGREKRAVFVAVDLLENQAKHRSVDQRFVVFLNPLAAVAGEIVGVEKREQILQRRQAARPPLAVRIFQHGGGVQRQRVILVQAADVERRFFKLGRLEERAIEIRHVGERLFDLRRALFGLTRQHVEKELFQRVEIFDARDIQERLRRIAFVIGEQLRFQ